ncbi:MAG: hypothetical protein QME81_14000 [bacterium]|nr:hypothetical protein [bacterium]
MKTIKPLDRSLKVLARMAHKSFIKLIMPDTEGVTFLGQKTPYLDIPEQRLDEIYHLAIADQEVLVNLEFQTVPSYKVTRRTFVQNGLLTEAEELPVISVIIYLERGRYRHFPDCYQVRLGGLENRFSFQTIRLWEHQNRIEEGELLELAPLLVLIEDKPGEETLEKERELISQVEDRKERLDLLSLAVTVAHRRFNKEFLEQFFKEELVMLKESSIIQDWIDEGVQQGIQQGIQQGMQQGIEQGRHDELVRMVQEALIEKWDKEMESLLSFVDQTPNSILEHTLLRIVRDDQDGVRVLLKKRATNPSTV